MEINATNGLLADIFDLNAELERKLGKFPSLRKSGPTVVK